MVQIANLFERYSPYTASAAIREGGVVVTILGQPEAVEVRVGA
jgi:hypothetical protein